MGSSKETLTDFSWLSYTPYKYFNGTD